MRRFQYSILVSLAEAIAFTLLAEDRANPVFKIFSDTVCDTRFGIYVESIHFVALGIFPFGDISVNQFHVVALACWGSHASDHTEAKN